MPVPASINDLSTTAGNNSPAGSESPTTTDDYLRALAAFIAALRDANISQASSVTALQTGKQPLDATLTALAGLATGADRLPYFTGLDAASQTPITSFARTLLDDADEAAARGTLGISVADGGLGYGQTWQDVTASRAIGVTYTNTDNKPRYVAMQIVGNCGKITVNGVVIFPAYSADSGNVNSRSFIVPPGETYSISGGNTPTAWSELK